MERWGAEWELEPVRGHGSGPASHVTSVGEAGGRGEEGHSVLCSMQLGVLTEPFLRLANATQGLYSPAPLPGGS